MMYTLEQLLKAIKFACEYQKASDYQSAGQVLLADDYDTTDQDVKLLDKLASGDTSHEEIELTDIFE